MTERFATPFDPFVLPFLFGMAFVLGYCLIAMVKVVRELPSQDRKRFLISLVTPSYIWKNIRDIFLNCLIHVKLWKRNKVLGYMHMSIAFGWFMLILIGHLEVMTFLPQRLHLFYYPIFFNYFVVESEPTLAGKIYLFLMDLSLLLVLSGIALAIVKRLRSRIFGMRRTTRPSFLDSVGLYSLWSIFPLRLLAEAHTAGTGGGSFLTLPLYALIDKLLGENIFSLPFWWVYSIALGVFMCVLPFTRYMHIPAEMLLIPLRNAGIKVRHSRKGFARVEVYSCPGCGVCIDACPMSVKKANIKDATVYLNRQIRRGNERRIEEISDKCLMCGKCTELCQVGVEGPLIRLAQRAIRKYGVNQDYSCVDISSLKEQVRPSAGKVLYFPGCMTALTSGIGAAVRSVLDKAGVEFGTVDPDDGICCGRPLLTAGRIEQAKALISKNEELILGSGCSTLLLSCPICYKVFRDQYKLPGVRVVHHSELFSELIGSGAISPVASPSHRLVFHDPCELGRGEGIYDQPRDVLASVGTVVEAGKSHGESICCGGSLGSLTLGFGKREAITKNSIENLKAGNPDVIVTACPLCRSTFGRYSDLPVKDIAEVLDKACHK